MQRAHLKREIVETLLFVGLVFLIVHLGIETHRVVDNSMSPTLQPDQLVIVNRTAYLLGSPSRGDVVLIVDPTNLKREFIERVVAVPGDTVTISPSAVEVNGVTLHEPYVQLPPGVSENATVVPTLKLRDNQYFVLDDNRLAGPNDSRTFGPIARSNILGQAALVFWPLSQFGGISSDSSVFSAVNR
jgi:signal peptidase I